MRALILIDIQNDYFAGGAMELVGSEAAAARAARLLESSRGQGLPVFHIQHVAARPTATFFLPGTKGAEIYPGVAPLAGEAVIQKHYPNSFRETCLLGELQAKGVTELVIAGMMTHMCVDTTVRAACDLGFACLLAHDACATRDLNFNGASVAAAAVQLAYMAALNGLFAQVVDTEAVCSALSR